MRQGLQLRVSQHLALTPQLQQSIRLLQLSTLELNAEIDQALQENPLLERDEPGDAGTFAAGQASAALATPQAVTPAAADERDERQEPQGGDDEGWGMDFSGSHGQRDPNDDDMDSGETQAASTSLREHLGAQVAMTQLSDRERALVGFLIEALDDDGYLTQALDELVDLLVADDDEAREALLEELAIALRHLQNLDPPGIGARNARECLSLQLDCLPPSATRALALRIVKEHLEHLAARDFARIKKALDCDDDRLRPAQSLIRSLNPRPGAQFAPIDTRYVIPDVAVKKAQGRWVVSLNRDAMPRLRINRLYADILQRHRSGGNTSAGLAGQLQEAKWLIKNVQQRFDTILRVSQAIVDRPARLLRPWRGGYATADPARDRRNRQPARIDDFAGDDPEIPGQPPRHLRTQILFWQPRRHRYRRRGFLNRNPGADQAIGRRRGRQKAALGRPACGNPRRAGHRRGASHRREVPRTAQYPAG
jgi:RNA polymerase sigma-54 factor